MTAAVRWIGVAALVGWFAPLMPGVARADHYMGTMSENHQDRSELSVGLAVEAARYDNTIYLGSYQGVAHFDAHVLRRKHFRDHVVQKLRKLRGVFGGLEHRMIAGGKRPYQWTDA